MDKTRRRLLQGGVAVAGATTIARAGAASVPPDAVD